MLNNISQCIFLQYCLNTEGEGKQKNEPYRPNNRPHRLLALCSFGLIFLSFMEDMFELKANLEEETSTLLYIVKGIALFEHIDLRSVQILSYIV